MARPRVLVSSTCEDLYIIREQLRALIDDMGYEAVLSEEGDIYYSPDLHVHLSCIREVSNCDMVVLIVGNRFGSEYVVCMEKSVTQTEHDTAYLWSIPIFAFIDQRVLNDYATYRRVLDKANQDHTDPELLISSIPFGSNTDIRVFKFIDDIREKITNNAYFPFRNFGDIKESLKKQWAGMLFDFLKQRSEEYHDKKVFNLLGKLEIASGKVEQIVELIAENSLSSEKQQNLKAIDVSTKEKRMNMVLQEIWQGFDLESTASKKAKKLTKIQLEKLYGFLFDEMPVKDSIREFQKCAQELGLLNSKSGYVHFSLKYRLGELRETIERHKIPKETVLKSLKNTLIAAIQKIANDLA